MIYVGIDVAKDKHECMIITDENKIVTPCFSFPNTREGFQRLYREIHSRDFAYCYIKKISNKFGDI